MYYLHVWLFKERNESMKASRIKPKFLSSLSHSRRLVVYKNLKRKKKGSRMLFNSNLTKFLFKHLIKIQFITFCSFSSINNKHALNSKAQVVQLLLQGSSKVKNITTHYIWTLWEGVPERENNHYLTKFPHLYFWCLTHRGNKIIPFTLIFLNSLL